MKFSERPLCVEAGSVHRKAGGLYRLCCLAKDGRTLQEKVVYMGLEGADAGQFYVCTLSDFSMRFTLVEAQPAAAEPVAAV